MEIILGQSNNVTDDWNSYKKLKLGRYGYMAITLNFPEISSELSRLKKLIKKFNTSRRNIIKFKDVIKNYRKTEVSYIDLQLGPQPFSNDRKGETITRLEKKSSPYGSAELKEICLQAFTSEYIRGFCERWKIKKEVLEDINDNTVEVLEQLKLQFPRLKKWDNKQFMEHLCENWEHADKMQIEHNRKIFNFQKENKRKQNKDEFLERENANPENEIKINDTNQELLGKLIEESSETLDWSKAAKLTRYTEQAPSIIINNITEVNPPNINACPLEIEIRDSPSNRLDVATSYLDLATQKWHESKRASHPFLEVDVSKINPKKRNEIENFSARLQLMADSGAMCSLLNYESVRAMGLEPEKLEKSNVSITGVNGKKLAAQTRQMCVRIVNTRTGTESWEKLYVHPDIKTSLLSKDCLIRLGVIDPKNFLDDDEVDATNINTVNENKTKLSACEKSFGPKEDGSIGCKCPPRTEPPKFIKEDFEAVFD